MELTATMTSITRQQDGSTLIQFRVHPWSLTDDAADKLVKMQPYNLCLDITRYRDKRSLSANALMWKCCTSLAEILNTTKEEVYMKALRDYGVEEIVTVVPEAESKLRAVFKDVIPVGRYTFGGRELVEYRCIWGSSTYNTEEMSRLLNGVIGDCKEMGGFVPDERMIMTGLEIWKQKGEA